jgi:hypothetical protein
MADEITITNEEMWALVDQFNDAYEGLERALRDIRRVFEDETFPPMPDRGERYYRWLGDLPYHLEDEEGEDWAAEYLPIIEIMDRAMVDFEMHSSNLTEGLYAAGRAAKAIEEDEA